MALTGKDLIKIIQDAGAEDFVAYIAENTDPLGFDFYQLDADDVMIEENKIIIA